jgi:Branched-chain amino acid transport protein (AzlD)
MRQLPQELRICSNLNSSCFSELWPYLALIVVGFLPNEVWRWLGLIAARGLDEDSQIIVWVRAVATAILAGVIAQLISTSSGVLATIPLSVRIAAAVAGFIAFLVVRRSVIAGVVVGELVLLLSPAVRGR